jgi:ADP-ribose pyrophosphatase
MTPSNTDQKLLLEKLAEQEHEQWVAWTRHLLENQTPENVARWRRQMQTSYDQLTEEEKEADRVWARKALTIIGAPGRVAEDILHVGRFLQLRQIKSWEYVERTKVSGVVVIVAVTPENNLLLIEQHRPPVGKLVIEMPAGLAGDITGQEHEALAVAAQRELLEETGYWAERMEYLTEGPTSAGLTSEIITLFRATQLQRKTKGGGDGTENIRMHEVPLDQVDGWLREKNRAGQLIDPKVYAGLHFVRTW